MFWKKKRNAEEKVSKENFAIQDDNLGEVSGGKTYKTGRGREGGVERLDTGIAPGGTTISIDVGGSSTGTGNK